MSSKRRIYVSLTEWEYRLLLRLATIEARCVGQKARQIVQYTLCRYYDNDPNLREYMDSIKASIAEREAR